MGVMLAILCGSERQHWLHPLLLHRVLEAPQDLPGRNLELRTIMDASPVDRARNEAVTQFLASGCDWLVQIDNDTVPAPHFLRMIPEAEARGIQVCACPTPFIGDAGVSFNVGAKRGTRYDCPSTLKHGWSKWDVLGTAVFIVHRRVLEVLGPPYFQVNAAAAVHLGKACNEDFDFCDKARAAGFDCWAHGDYPASHYHQHDLLQVISQINRAGVLR